MLMRDWMNELSAEAKSVWPVLKAFWMEEVRSILATVGVFLLLAAPIILVILILWYLDSIGWQSGSGFYTIGLWVPDWVSAKLA